MYLHCTLCLLAHVSQSKCIITTGRVFNHVGRKVVHDMLLMTLILFCCILQVTSSVAHVEGNRIKSNY